MKRLLYILFLLFLLAACRENKKEQFARLVQEWQGKEIVFPQDMVFTVLSLSRWNTGYPMQNIKC